jgi:hypothetical protein
MATLKYDVPTLAQEKPMCCWHTSAMMIWLYWQGQSGRQGPMNTLGPVYEADKGLSASPQELITLGKTTGLMAFPNRANYSNADLYATLKQCGPLWCAGTWYGFGHVIVLTGVDGGTVFLNDPDRGVKKQDTVDWFNKKLMSSLQGCVLYKDPTAY